MSIICNLLMQKKNYINLVLDIKSTDVKQASRLKKNSIKLKDKSFYNN